MKPPPFAYAAPAALEDALALLAEHGDESRILAGGQSLMPLLALRIARPGVVVDIGRIAALAGWRSEAGWLCIGANVRQRALLHDRRLRAAAPLLAAAAPYIGHPATRSRGTVVGSLCHADPAAELPVCARVLDAELVVASRRGGRRVAAGDFFAGALATALDADEVVTELRVPAPPPRTGYAFCEVARRHGDFALVAVACAVSLDAERRIAAGRLGLGGVAETPLGFDLAELTDGVPPGAPDPDLLRRVAARVAGRLEPGSDLHATGAYRRWVAGTLVERALALAAGRAAEAG